MLLMLCLLAELRWVYCQTSLPCKPCSRFCPVSAALPVRVAQSSLKRQLPSSCQVLQGQGQKPAAIGMLSCLCLSDQHAADGNRHVPYMLPIVDYLFTHGDCACNAVCAFHLPYRAPSTCREDPFLHALKDTFRLL